MSHPRPDTNCNAVAPDKSPTKPAPAPQVLITAVENGWQLDVQDNACTSVHGFAGSYQRAGRYVFNSLEELTRAVASLLKEGTYKKPDPSALNEAMLNAAGLNVEAPHAVKPQPLASKEPSDHYDRVVLRVGQRWRSQTNPDNVRIVGVITDRFVIVRLVNHRTGYRTTLTPSIESFRCKLRYTRSELLNP